MHGTAFGRSEIFSVGVDEIEMGCKGGEFGVFLLQNIIS